MSMKKEIIADYKKRMQELVDACKRTATLLADPIRKEKVNHLALIGLEVFKALELLEKANAKEMKCKKCGSIARCSSCGTKITLF